MNTENKKVIYPKGTTLPQIPAVQPAEANAASPHFQGKIRIPVRLLQRGKEALGYTEKFSEEGLLLVMDVPISPGTPLNLQCAFGDICHLNLSGSVVSCHGVGNIHSVEIRFAAVHEWEQRILSSSIDELRANASVQKRSLLAVSVGKDYMALEAADFAKQVRQTKIVKAKRKFTPHPGWIIELDQSLEPYRKAIRECRLLSDGLRGTLSLKQMRAWIIQLYPFIEMYPQWIALNISKAPDVMSRGFLIDNLRVEKRHAEQWLYMAQGFGIPLEDLYSVEPSPEVEALSHWMWSINTRGSLVEGVSATNYAIEGVTQDIARTALTVMPMYDGQDGVTVDHKTSWWMREHVSYDDEHPLEALEIIKLHTTTKDLQEKVWHSAKRSLEYLLIALDTCYEGFAESAALSSDDLIRSLNASSV